MAKSWERPRVLNLCHHTHACQHCGMVWRPAVVPTVGVYFLPGFKNTDTYFPLLKEKKP